MDMRAAAETTFMDDGLSPDRSLEYSLHKKRFSFKRKGASNALLKTSGPAFGVHVRYHGKVTKHAREMPQSIKLPSLVERLRCFCNGDGIVQRLEPFLRRICARMSDGHVTFVIDVALHEHHVLLLTDGLRVFVRDDVESLVSAAALRCDEIAGVCCRCHEPLYSAGNTSNFDFIRLVALIWCQSACHFSTYAETRIRNIWRGANFIVTRWKHLHKKSHSMNGIAIDSKNSQIDII